MEHRDKLSQRLKELATLRSGEIVTDERLFNFKEIEAEVSLVLDSAQAALDYPGFVDELPEPDAQQLSTAVEGMFAILSKISRSRYDSTWLGQYYQNAIDEVKNRYRELYNSLVKPIREYSNSIESNEARLKELLSEVDALKGESAKIRAESAKAREESEAVAKQAQEAAAKVSTVELSKHFDSLVGDKKSYTWADRKRNFKRNSKNTDVKNNWLVAKRRAYNFYLKLYSLIYYLWKKAFITLVSYNEGYQRDARFWFYGVLISVAATIKIADYIKDDFNDSIRDADEPQAIIAIALVKILLIVAPLYAVRLSVRNYSANKHLAVINQHKSVVMKTLLAFMARKEIASPIKGDITIEAVRETFVTPETGFINNKDRNTSIEQNIFDRITKDNAIR